METCFVITSPKEVLLHRLTTFKVQEYLGGFRWNTKISGRIKEKRETGLLLIIKVQIPICIVGFGIFLKVLAPRVTLSNENVNFHLKIKKKGKMLKPFDRGKSLQTWMSKAWELRDKKIHKIWSLSLKVSELFERLEMAENWEVATNDQNSLYKKTWEQSKLCFKIKLFSSPSPGNLHRSPLSAPNCINNYFWFQNQESLLPL